MTIAWLSSEEKETGRVRKEAASQLPAQPHPCPDQHQPPPGRATMPHLNNSWGIASHPSIPTLTPTPVPLQAGSMRHFPVLQSIQKLGMINLKSPGSSAIEWGAGKSWVPQPV